jgi:hypothetical protein
MASNVCMLKLRDFSSICRDRVYGCGKYYAQPLYARQVQGSAAMPADGSGGAGCKREKKVQQ